MAHFAKVLNGRVVDGMVCEPEFLQNEFVDTSPGEWIKTSYNTRGGVHYTEQEDRTRVPSEDQSKALRYNYAAIGGWYDADADAFYSEKPYDSWVLNTTSYTWHSPIGDAPDDGQIYEWNEATQTWEQMSGGE